MGKKHLTEDYVRTRLKEAHGDDFKYITGLLSTHKKATFECKEGHCFDAIVRYVLKKKFRCPVCNHSQPYTADEIQDMLDERYNGTVKINKQTFKAKRKHASFHCTVCDYDWITFPDVLLKPTAKGCPNCIHKRPYEAHEINLKIIKESKGKIHMIEETFIKTNAHALMECDKGHQWWAFPNSIYNKHRGCGQCSNHYKHSYEDDKARIDEKFNKTITFNKEEHNGVTCDIHFYCTICEHTFISSIHEILNTQGCPFCLSKSLESPVLNALNNKKAEYYHNKGLKGCHYNGSKTLLRPDFRFKNYKLIIECDGNTHFYPIYGEQKLEEVQKRDAFKNEYYKKEGYILLRVVSTPEYEALKYITLTRLLELIEIGIDSKGNINLDVFRPYDFNRE